MLFCTVSTAEGIHAGYCGGNISKKGCISISGEGWFHAAAILTSDVINNYQGCDITMVRAGLASRLNIDTLKVWVRNNLNGEDLANGTVVFGEGQSIIRGWNDIMLDKSFKIGNKTDICIGYSFHQKKTSSAISAVGTPVENSFFLDKGNGWEDMNSLGALSIEAVLTGGDFAQFDLALKEAYAMKSNDKGTNFSATIENKGTSDVSGFDITTTVEGYSDTFLKHFDINIPGSSTVEVRYNIDIPESYEAGTKNEIKAIISSISNGEDENMDNNEVSVRYSYKKCVLIEEFTSESCGNCPRASKAVEELMTNDYYAERVIPVTHHSGYYPDWLTTDAGEEYTWFYNTSGTYAPAMMYDRYPFFLTKGDKGDPTPVGEVPDKDYVKTYIDKRLESFSHVTFDMNGEYDNKVTITIKVKGERDKRFSKTDERITVFLLEDDIKAKKQNGGGNDYIHNYVLRAWNSIWGDVIEWNDNSFKYECSLTLDPYWIKNNLHITAFVSSYNPENPAECVIENARDIRFETVTGIEEISSDKETIKTEYFTIDGIRANVLGKGLFIEKRTFNDGSQQVKKIYR